MPRLIIFSIASTLHGPASTNCSMLRYSRTMLRARARRSVAKHEYSGLSSHPPYTLSAVRTRVAISSMLMTTSAS